MIELAISIFYLWCVIYLMKRAYLKGKEHGHLDCLDREINEQCGSTKTED